jgi:hypothetical protein
MRLCLAICLASFCLACGSPRVSGQPVDDAAVVQAVKAKLTSTFGPIENRQVRQLERGADKETVTFITVDSANGVVTLTGEVATQRAKAMAGEIAHGVSQVVSVKNNLAVAPGYSDDAAGAKR